VAHPSDIAFRIAAEQDAQAIADLLNSAYRGESSRAGWTTEADFLAGQRTDTQAVAAIIASPAQWFLLGERDNMLLGSVCLERADARSCHFGMFAVRPELQGQGMGKRFLAEAEGFARDRLGCVTMRMLVITLRAELIAWYERRGYRRTGELDVFPYGDERFGIPLRDDLKFEVMSKNL
jgi:ribosomal protein S18 acetylase RimI-like enzyme